MDFTDTEMISHGEVDSPLPPELLHPKPHTLSSSSIGRQTSIYSLTLDELQNTMCESGKNFGSMNMDEFLSSIWTAEEHQAQATSSAMPAVNNNIATTNHLSLPIIHENTTCIDDHKVIAKQPSLPRQGSLSIPAPLSQKTVDEVWTEIHRSQQQDQEQDTSNIQNPANCTPPQQQQRQLTFGEMTLEDFLVRAGVVREQAQPTLTPTTLPAVPQQQMYGSSLYPNTNPNLIGTSTFVTRPVMTLGGVNVAPPYPPIMQPIVGEIPAYHGAVKRGGGYTHQSGAEAPSLYGGRMGNGSGGSYAHVQPLAMASPVSPVSPDGLGNQADGTNYGMDMSGIRGGRKRVMDGPVEKVVERRQRRMIKNRESAARSRARKQAYTVELEAELNQLKEENTHLKQVISELERKSRQQMEEMRMKAETKAQKTCGRLRMLRRTTSYPA